MAGYGKAGPSKQQKNRIPAHKKLKRNGSELFDRPAGMNRHHLHSPHAHTSRIADFQGSALATPYTDCVLDHKAVLREMQFTPA